MASTATGKRRPIPVVWDPSCPAKLLLPTQNASRDNENAQASQELLRLDPYLSHDGVGCNDHETSALMNLLYALESYVSSDFRGKWSAFKSLSKSYRQALQDCLVGWEDELQKVVVDDGSQTETTMESDEEDNLDLNLFKIVYAVVHLSEIFLLLPPPSGDYDDTATMQGAVTADTIRYLRLHHFDDPLASSTIEEMLNSTQPDQFDSELFWNLVHSLVLRGCLEDAWAVLSRHSACRRCFDPPRETMDEYHLATLEEDREGFLALRAVLLSAPLPGGRNSDNDAGLGGASDDHENKDDDEIILNGVPRSSYKLWEIAGDSTQDGDFPIRYNPHAAMAVHRTWTKYVTELAPLHNLTRRMPQLQTIISMLRGDFQNVVFDSWNEALCAELLYLRPALRPDDLHIRAERVMEKFGESSKGFVEQVILSVMKGDAGRAISVLHECGGGSGAALPATMTALLCNLFVEAKLLPSKENSSESSFVSIQTEMLLSASYAILSSLPSTQNDVGVRLSTRLLLPYAKPRGDIRIVATLSETFERYDPPSDGEAENLIALCRSLVEKKSIRALDGCVSLVLSRYRHCVADKRPGGAIRWLLKGIELERLAFSDNTVDATGDWQSLLASGVCGRFLTSSCVLTSKALLRGVVEGEAALNVGRDFTTAKQMVSVIREDETSIFVQMIPEVKLLFEIYGMTQASVEGDGDDAIARRIIACLEESADNTNDGSVSVLAHPSMYDDLLSLAHSILHHDEVRYDDGSSDERFISSFGVQGIHVLMNIFTQVTFRDGNGVSVGEEEPTNEMNSIRLALCKGLMRAFVSENAKRQDLGQTTSDFSSVIDIRSSQLSSYSRSEQERAVELMLEM